MTRDDFTAAYKGRTRFVIQKHDRVNAVARALAENGSTPARERAYAVAQTNLDAALDQEADQLFDMFEAMVNRAVAEVLGKLASLAGAAS